MDTPWSVCWSELELKVGAGQVLMPIQVQPRASKTEIIGVAEGRLRVRLKAPPVDGAANKELLRFLGRKVLGVAPSSLTLLRGANARSKVVAIEGTDPEKIRAALAAWH